MEEKETSHTEDPRHEVRPEHKILHDAMAVWASEAGEDERRSVIVIQAIAKDGELNASSHISGNGQHLAIAAQACMSTLTPDNPVGTVLRTAAIRSLSEIGLIAPHEQLTPVQSGSPDPETHNNNEHE